MRWTKARCNVTVDDAVIERRRQVHHGARNELLALPDRTHDPACWGPMMATSGRLITGGGDDCRPGAPRLVMVMVEPVSSARVARPLARRLGQALHFGGHSPTG